MSSFNTQFSFNTPTYAAVGREPPTLPLTALASKDGVLCDTGFDEDVYLFMWETYKMFLPYRSRNQPLTSVYFYLLFVYINFYPTKAQFSRVMTTPFSGPVSYSTLHSAILPLAYYLAAALNTNGTIDWARRLLRDSHHPFFPLWATTIVDCFPVVVQAPSHPELHRLLNQGKYKATVIKGEVVINFLGEIVAFSFPHIGVRNDSKIWQEQTLQKHPMLPHEWCLGDGAYVACEGCITKYTVNCVHGPLTKGHRAFNRNFNMVRQRVEHVIGHIKNRALFRQPFRGSYEQCVALTTIVAHTVNARTRLHGPLYEPYGNWTHFPEPEQ